MKNLNEYKIVRYLKWGLYYILRPFVMLEHRIYSKFFRNNNKIKRLFVTTGNISLVNSLAIINEIGDFDKYDDTLIIGTGKGTEEFFKKQLEIAKLHNFKIVNEIRLFPAAIAVLHNIYAVDEVYALNHPLFNTTVLPLFPCADLIFIDEGAGSLINHDCEKFKNLKKFKTHNYKDKVDFVGLKDKSIVNFESVDVKEFRKISDILSKQSPIEFPSNSEDKYILYCGVCWENVGITQQEYIELQTTMLNEILDAGYKILYKPHPRDNEYYGFDKNPNVIFLTSKYPIELYNLDIVAILSINSTASLSYPHYWDVPGFCNIPEKTIFGAKADIAQNNIIRYIVKEYSLDYKYLLNFDVKNLSKNELKKQIKNFYDEYLNKKEKLSENKQIYDYWFKVNEQIGNKKS